jgi:hypothetical protein
MPTALEILLNGVLTPTREQELWDLLKQPQDGGKPSPLEQMFINSTRLMQTDMGRDMTESTLDLVFKYALGMGGDDDSDFDF